MSDDDEAPAGGHCDGRNGDEVADTALFDASDDEVPDFEAARDHVVDQLVGFVRSLRRANTDVPANATLTATRALVEVGFERDDARPALRAALITDKGDIETFDKLFDEFWDRLTAGFSAESPADYSDEEAPDGGPALIECDPTASEGNDQAADSEDGDDQNPVEVATRTRDPGGTPDDSDDVDVATRSTYSPRGSQAGVDADATPTGDLDVERSVQRLTEALASLQGRRFSPGNGSRPDARRALRESIGTGGAVLGVPHKERDPASVRALLLVDVSQSVLDVVDEGFLVAFLRAARDRWRHAPVFFFDEHVREVSTQFDAPSAEATLAALERAETEWGGGTRIGHTFETVRRDHSRTVDRDTIVFVVSDGLETGDLDDLESGMAWLARRAHGVLWLNPLAAAEEYEPAVSGMATALPYLDGLFAFAGPDDVAEIAHQLRLRGLHGAIGYDQDPRRHEQ